MAGAIIEANSSDTLRKVRKFVRGLPSNDYAKCSELVDPIKKITGLGDDELPIQRACISLSTGDEVIDWLETSIDWDQPKDKFFPVKKVRQERKRINQIKRLMRKEHDVLMFTEGDGTELNAKPINNRELLIALNIESQDFIYQA